MNWLALRIGSRVMWCFVASLGFMREAAAATNSAKQVTVAPMPDWVQPRDWKMSSGVPASEKSEGSRYLLYENQAHPQRQERFVRVVNLMENETGVQDYGNLSFDFDPSFQELIVHSVRIHRGGQVLDRLDEKKLKVIQPESGFDSHLLTGRKTALLLVEDLRVGDALEYAYTTRGENPILSGHFASRYTVRSSIPLGSQRVRVVWDSSAPLQLRQHLLELPPTKTAFGGGTEYLWDFDAAEPIAWEDIQPLGYEPYPYVEFSDFADWARVVDWAVPLYQVATTNPPAEFQELIARWQREGKTEEERARMALQFVQDDLRYTGEELGPDSYRPAPPYETFVKRFGDCKGKVALLCLMLRQLNIEAFPALVNTYKRDATARRLPSPFAFNHVIVKLRLDGKELWVDPTSSQQGGSLWQRFLPPYGKALIVRAGNRELEDVPAPAPGGARQVVDSHFTIRDYLSPVKFSVKTAYHGADADDMRETLARSDMKELAKNYLNYYARYYPDITNGQALAVHDDRKENVITISEGYSIRHHWKTNDTKAQIETTFYAESLEGFLSNPTTRLRKMPLRINYPQRREQHVTVELPNDKWNLVPSENEVSHAAFKFKYRREIAGHTVKFHYECETKAAEVASDGVAAYLAKRTEMENLLGDTLFRPISQPKNFLARLNWLMIAVAMLGFAGAIGLATLAWRLLLRRSAPGADELPPVLVGVDDAPRGLGGWLVLVGIGLCMSPFVTVGTMAIHWEGFFSLEVWQMFASPASSSYRALYAPIVILEVLANASLLGLNLLALVLYFGRRRAFPKVLIALLLARIVVVVADSIAVPQLHFAAEVATDSTALDLSRVVLSGVIWSAYAVVSRRVKATFVR